jgi:hypothetical protein
MTLPAARGVWSCFLSCTFVLATAAWVCAQDELPPEIDADGIETLTRGPVHEAFASPTLTDPKPGLVIPKAPPPDVKEQPPEFQPEGVNVQWIPGYWAWDDDREDFIWISGVWRDPPPGKRWVPGYWAEVTGGFQWVPGFWIDEALEEMEYLRPPPESLEQGPSVAAPADNYFYIPGTWTYVNNDYIWSAGYWAPYREEWVYVPSHWVWTPRGYIFVAGYWDWRVPRRGQIFAPIIVAPHVYARPNFFYTPRCVINTSSLFVHLWVRDSYCHYYFGNYYGPTYAHRHFTPWCNYTFRPRCYDPIFAWCNVHYHRQGINYAQRMKGWHTHFVNHTHERPPITWRDQLDRQRHLHDHDQRPGGRDLHRNYFLAQDLKEVIRAPEKTWKRQDPAARDLQRASIEQVKQLHTLRLEQEKIRLVSRDVPGREHDHDDKRPGDRSDRSARTPSVSDKPNVADLKLGNKLAGQPPADKIAAGQEGLSNKVKLPRPALTSLSAQKPKIDVPEAPEKHAVSRPVIRPDRLNQPRPNLGQAPGLKTPELNSPSNGPAKNVSAEPRRGDAPREDRKPLTTREPAAEPKKPNLDGNTNSAPLQQKLETIRQQQQETLNKARNRTSTPVGPQVTPKPEGLNLGGNPPRTQTPRSEAPRAELPKVETPRRDNTPRNLGGNPGGNMRGNSQPKADSSPRSFTPKVEPRNSAPAVQPRASTPAPNPSQTTRLAKPVTERPVAPQSNIQPQAAPRPAATPRFAPNNNNKNQGGGNDRRRSR